jgi:hypothetical protein
MRTVPLTEYASTTLDAQGNGTIALGPARHANVWHPSSVSISANGSLATNAVPGATCSIYAGGLANPQSFVDSTYNVTNAASSVIDGQVVYAGQYVFAVWAGATPGCAATLIVYGTQDTV